MARLTRAESHALTRAKLLASARAVVARLGYENATIDKIAEDAGFSKGAFYSNFASKEELFLELLESHAMQDVAELRGLVGGAKDPEQLIEIVGEWADMRAADPSWAMLAMELLRQSQRNATFGERHANLFREQWHGVGELLQGLFPPRGAPVKPEAIGGLVLELTYSSVAGFVSGPGAGDLVRLALRSLYAAYGHRSAHRRNR